jgi:hypothetical protein
MKTFLKENSLDWAITHLCRYCDSDLFPRVFEFDALWENWQEAKAHLLSINLESHTPKPPLLRFVPKLSGAQRVVHRLDPIDSVIYTAMAHQIHDSIQGIGGAQTARIAPARIDPAAGGAFFSTVRNVWQQHTERIDQLAGKYPAGYVLMTDIVDFFGRIQPARLAKMLVDPAGTQVALAPALNRFLSALNTASDRGIPVGPAASTVLAEVVLAAIDREIANYTTDFCRWGDDLRIFFDSQQAAEDALRGLSDHLHKVHELMLVPQKTRVVPVQEFLDRYHRGWPDETIAAGPAEARLSEVVGQSHIVPQTYGWMTSAAAEPRPASVHIQLQTMPEFQTVDSTYLAHFDKAVAGNPPDLMCARRILRKATTYRMRSLIPAAVHNFARLTPVIRELCSYFKAVMGEEEVQTYATQFRHIWDKEQQGSSYINDWMCHWLTNPAFNQIDLPSNYSGVLGIRKQALIALRKQDLDWVKKHAARIDELDPWDRRGVLYASSMMPQSERASLLAAALGRGEILERSIVRHIGAQAAGSDARKPQEKLPCNYPSYGDKSAAKGPDNYPSYGDKSAARGPDNYPAYGSKAIRPTPAWLTERSAEMDALLLERGNEIMVGVQDSVDAGNCREESEPYLKALMARLGLSPEASVVSASDLLADRDDDYARRAARAAAMRFKTQEAAPTGPDPI